MRKLKRSPLVHALFFGLMVLAANSWAQERSPVIEQIAKVYGIDSFGEIDAIRYTWNGEIPGLFKVAHAWEWEPKTNKVSYEGKDKDGKPVKVSYTRFDAHQTDAVKNEIEPSFVNDNYWLIFPFHASWDKSAAITDEGMKKVPIGAGSANLVSVKYPAEVGGYTPGDTWDLYVGKDNRVVQFVYHRGGDKKPKLVTASWTGYKKAGPLLLSTEHKGTADGKPLHIWISDVAVKVAGSDKWVNAQ